MPSFTTVIANIKTALEGNSALDSFCAAKWGESVTVRKVFKQRIEITKEQLPIIFITRPSNEKELQMDGSQYNREIVRLYCGFYQPDPEKALDEMIEFEEMINDALLADKTRGGNAMMTYPNASASDEGIYHPTYFTVMDVLIRMER